MMLLLLLVVAGLPEQPESAIPPDSLSMVAISRWDRGAAEAVAVSNGITYLGTGTSLLVMPDSLPAFVVTLPGQCHDLVVDGGWLYAAVGKAGLVVLSLDEPERPQPVGGLDLPGYALAFAKSGTLGAVASADYGVSLIDLSDPSVPRLASAVVPAESALAVTISVHALYVACGRGGLVAIDATRPETPMITMRLETPGPALGVARKDSVVYVMCGDSGVLAVNSSGQPQPPRPVRFYWPGALAMAVSADIAAVVCGWNGVWLVDITNPMQPIFRSYLLPPGYGRDVAGQQGMLALAMTTSGAIRYDVTQPASPVFLSRLALPGYTVGVAVAPNAAWVVTSDGLHAVDLNPRPARDLGFCPLPGQPAGLALAADCAVLALGSAGVAVVGTSDPQHPSVVATLAVTGEPISVAAQDSWAFVGTRDSGIKAVSLAVPEQPVVTSSLPIAAAVEAVSVQGGVMAAAASDSGVWLIDVSDPRAPAVPVPPLRLGRACGVSVAGGLTAACGSFGLCLIDTRDIRRPTVLSVTPLAAPAWRVALCDSLCYVAEDWIGVIALNIRDPRSPFVAGYYAGATIAGDVKGLSRRALDASRNSTSEFGIRASDFRARSAGDSTSAAAGNDLVMADIYSGLTRLRLEPVQAASGPSQLDPLFQARVPAVSLPPSIAMHAKVQHAPAIVSLFDPAGRCHGRTRLDQTGIWQPVTFPAFPLGAGTYFVRLEGDSGTRVYRTQLLR